MDMLTRARGLLLLFAILLAADHAAMAQGTVISAGNAKQVQSSKQIDKRVYRLSRGPKAGELTLFDHAGGVEIVDDRNLEVIRLPARNIKALDFAMSADGKRQAWLEKGMQNYRVEEPETGKTFNLSVAEHGGGIAFSPDGQWIAAGYTFWDPVAEGAGYSEMRIYNATGELVHTTEQTAAGALRAFFSPDGKILAVGNRNDVTQIYETKTGKLLHTLDRKMTHDIVFSPDGKTLAAAYVDGHVGTWNVETGELRELAASGCEEVYSVDFSPKGDVLASSGNNGAVVLWDAAKLAKLKELEAQNWVIQVRFSADGSRLISAGAQQAGPRDSGQVMVWEVKE